MDDTMETFLSSSKIFDTSFSGICRTVFTDVYIGQVLAGYVLGWTAPVIPKLQDIEQTPLNHVFSDIQASWLGSSLFFGCTTGPYISGYLCNRIGRWPCFLLGGVICIMGFTILAIAHGPDTSHMFLGRIMTGCSNGILFVTNLVYIGEIASTNIRGLLLTLTGLSTAIGLLIVYTIGPFVPYWCICWLPILTGFGYLLALVMVVPESPVYQVIKGKRGEAIITLGKLGRATDFEFIESAASEEQKTMKEQLKEMFTEKANKRALFIITVLNISQQMSGIVAVILFVTTIFDLSGIRIQSHIATIIVGVTLVFASCFAPVCVDTIGRKSLLLMSTAGCSLSLFVLGTDFYLHKIQSPIVNNVHWLSLSSLMCFFISNNLGLSIIPATFIGEMFTQNVRSLGSSFTISVGWTVGFGITTSFGYMVRAFGAHITFWMYSATCAFAFVFTIFFVPETKGKTLLQIQEMLSK